MDTNYLLHFSLSLSMFFIPVPITFPMVSVMYMCLSHCTGGRLTHYCSAILITDFCFQYEYKERFSQKVRTFAMLSLSFSPQYDFSMNEDGLQIWKVAAGSWQGGRPQVWGLGKWLGTVTKCYADHGLEWILWGNPCNRKYIWDLKHKKIGYEGINWMSSGSG